MRVRDLGPLLVGEDGREQPVVGTKGSAMLSLLVIHVNRQVTTDALTEAAWGDHVSPGAASTLLSHIWRLRQMLEPLRRSGEAPRVLLNDAGGYRLVGSPASVDSLFFADSANRVREQIVEQHFDQALKGAEAALGRWRGRPYGPAADLAWAQPAVARLEELHIQLQERRLSALIGLGALDTVLSDLRPLIAAMPFHEVLRGLQMQALHLAGRTEEALQAFGDARRVLVDEVGIEPGRDLRVLHRRILDDDPSLAGPRIHVGRIQAPAGKDTEEVGSVSPGRASKMDAVTPNAEPADVHLPPTLTPLIGREAEVSLLLPLVRQHQLVTVTGSAGCGKTRVAVEVGRVLADTFADGVWFVDLVGVEDPSLVVDVVISTIGFVSTADSTPLEDLHRYLSTRHLLLILDNCEHLLPAVSTLLEVVLGDSASPPSCRVLATSRERLGLPGEVGCVLEPLALPPPDEAGDVTGFAAVQLLLQRLGDANPTLKMDAAALASVVRICIALDGLPLPLELAAARAPAYSLAEIADQVSTDPGRLRRPGRHARDHGITLRSTIERSYALLTDAERQAHRELAVLPGPFTSTAAAGVFNCELDDAQDTLVELVHRSMLARVDIGRTSTPAPTTFRQLVTVRDHALNALSESGVRTRIEDRRDAYTRRVLGERPPLGTVSEPAWFAALDQDQATLRATLTRNLIDQPTTAGGLLPAPLTFYWYYRGRLSEATRWLTLGHDLLLEGDPNDLAVAQGALAAILTLQARHEQARSYVAAAMLSSIDPKDPRLESLIEVLVGLVAAAWISDNHPLVISLQRHLDELVQQVSSPRLRLLVAAVGADALAAEGRLDEAVECAVDVQRRAKPLGVPMASWLVGGAPMAHALLGGNPDHGIMWAEQTMADHFPSGTGAGGAFIETRANFAAQQGDDLRAAWLFGAAHAITRRVGMRWPWRDLSLQFIEAVRHRLGDETFERQWRTGAGLTPLDVLERLRASS